ncbi:MAG: ATP-binding cassette domain-containing protein [Clostridiales bacterium]|nr:ATP-binding cassette domain-containing protein [Clostridiales bacterium]
MIEVRNLTKTYGSHVAVDHVSFTIDSGKIYGFLGPNGAGKSTTMNIITGCLAATEGTVTVDGHDIFEEPILAKKCIGYLPEMPPLYLDMTVTDYLRFVAEAKGVPTKEIPAEVARVMEKTGVTDMRLRLIKQLSKGYRQRVGLAQAILGDPKVIILDEPTVGLDPQQLIEIRELIRTLGRDRTVMLSSHIMQEISAVCDMLIIISGGKLVAEDTPENLEARAENGQTLRLTVRADEAEAREIVASLGETVEVRSANAGAQGETELEIGVTTEDDVRERLFYAFADRRCAILSMAREKQSLEDVFLALTGAQAPAQPVVKGGAPQ